MTLVRQLLRPNFGHAAHALRAWRAVPTADAVAFWGLRKASSDAHTALLQARWDQLDASLGSRRSVLDKFDAIHAFQQQVYAFDRLDADKNPFIVSSNSRLKEVLSTADQLDDKTLRELFARPLEFPTLQTVIEAYYARDPSAHIDAQLAMGPFRKLIWDGDFHRALDYIALTNGNQRFFDHRKQHIKRAAAYFGGSLVGLIGGIHAVVASLYPELLASGAGGTAFGIYGIYACIVTYFINCGFLATLSFSSRGMENGPLMFQHYTMPHDWYMKVEQMKMAARVLEADAEINGLDGFATKDVVDRIHALGFEVNEPEQEIMLRQYWYSSGDGFAWVEPDVDPAEQLWHDHLSDIGVRKVWEKNRDRLEADAEAAASDEVDESNRQAQLYFPDEKN